MSSLSTRPSRIPRPVLTSSANRSFIPTSTPTTTSSTSTSSKKRTLDQSSREDIFSRLSTPKHRRSIPVSSSSSSSTRTPARGTKDTVPSAPNRSISRPSSTVSSGYGSAMSGSDGSSVLSMSVDTPRRRPINDGNSSDTSNLPPRPKRSRRYSGLHESDIKQRKIIEWSKQLDDMVADMKKYYPDVEEMMKKYSVVSTVDMDPVVDTVVEETGNEEEIVAIRNDEVEETVTIQSDDTLDTVVPENSHQVVDAPKVDKITLTTLMERYPCVRMAVGALKSKN